MPAPSTADEYVQLVRKSGVVEEKRLDAYLQKLRAASGLPSEVGKVAGVMVRDALLTHFQAEQILMGRWRRFTIGKYKVLERLGSGGMGSVYLCEHIFMRRRVAVKVLPAAKSQDEAALLRFYREARAVAALDHPNVVRAYDIDQDDKLHFLVMEYVDGSSFQEIIKKCGPMDVTRACHYIRQAAIGLEHAHEAGLIHRDIKPGNILLDRTGVIKLLDMGLARFFQDDSDNLTRKHDENVLGTADYLAPEQALDSHAVDIRADIYGLGATFYYILTASTPFSEGTIAQKLIWHQTRQPKPIRSIRPEVPQKLAALVEKMMAKDADQRYQLPGEVVEALESWTQTPIGPPPDAELPVLSPAALAAGESGAPTQVALAQQAAARKAAATAQLQSATPPPVTANGPPVAATPPPKSSNPATGKPTVPGPVAVPKPRPAAAAAAQAVAEKPAQRDQGPIWEKLASDTQDLSGRADTAPNSPRLIAKKTTLVKPRSAAIEWLAKLPVRTWIAAAGTTIVLFAAVVWWIWSRGTPATVNVSPSSRIHVVSTRPNLINAFRTVAQALAQAQAGDRIQVVDEELEEALTLHDRDFDVTLEAAHPEGKPVTWRFPAALDADEPAFRLERVRNFKLKGFTFDGNHRARSLMLLTGDCSGLVLEDANFKNFQRYGLLVANCAGSERAPVRLTRLRFLTTQPSVESAVLFLTNPAIHTPPANEHITVAECRIEGPSQAAVLIDGPALDLNLRRNRLYKAASGIRVKKATAIRIRIESNTFCDLSTGLRFDTLPPVDNNRIYVNENLFSQVKDGLASTEGPFDPARSKLFTYSHNVYDKAGSKEGNIKLGDEPLDFPPLRADAAATNTEFLAYPKNGPLAKVGMPGWSPE